MFEFCWLPTIIQLSVYLKLCNRCHNNWYVVSQLSTNPEMKREDRCLCSLWNLSMFWMNGIATFNTFKGPLILSIYEKGIALHITLHWFFTNFFHKNSLPVHMSEERLPLHASCLLFAILSQILSISMPLSQAQNRTLRIGHVYVSGMCSREWHGEIVVVAIYCWCHTVYVISCCKPLSIFQDVAECWPHEVLCYFYFSQQ